MVIQWTNCSEQMPTDDNEFYIAMVGKDEFINKVSGKTIRECIEKCVHTLEVNWTPYTPEAWEELNR